MTQNVFLREEAFYQRDLDPIRQYVDQSAFYLSRMTDTPLQQARGAIVEKIKTRSFAGQRDPSVEYYERHNYEDREVTFAPLSTYLRTISEENLTVAPSMTCYVHASEYQSILSGYMDENVKLRNINKKEAAKQKALGNKDLADYYNNSQENNKLKNNAGSGALSSGGSIIRNPSGHSSLTSTTRTMTSIGNANNERIISGNRQYRTPEITINNLVVLAQTAEVDQIRHTLKLYDLKIPTIEDVMSCVKHSTKLYWRDDNQMKKIRLFVERLTDEERASVVYTGDLYHLRILNPEFIRTLITRLSRRIEDQVFDDPLAIIKKTDEMHVNYVHHICASLVKGINKDYTRIPISSQNIVAATCLNLDKTLIAYKELIRTFFLTANLPPSVAYIRDSVRRTVVLSDTDSTMFSCDEWVLWYFNRLFFDDNTIAVAGAVMFIATQSIAHSLAIYSANLNVERSKLYKASMKPEYFFPIFSLTSVGKHYFTYVMIKEGAVYKEPELELKGVHLKSSTSPKPVTQDARKMMVSILDTVMAGNKVSLNHWVTHVANLEKEIRRSIMAGESTFLSRLNIKSPEAYKVGPEFSNYRYHLFWERVFAPKYGAAPIPTYAAVKFPTLVTSKVKIAEWLEKIEDQDLKTRLTAGLGTRTDLKTVYVPQDYIEAYGIPSEIASILDVETLMLQHTSAQRLILESLGWFCKPDVPLSSQGY